MPHAGKPAPVLFRRDWNLNVFNNNDGFSNRYIWRPKSFTTGFGTLIDAYTWDMGPATKILFSTMEWRSPVLPVGHFDFVTYLQVEIRPTGKGYEKTVNVDEQHVGNIYRGRIDRLDAVYPKMSNFEADGVTLFWDPAWYDRDPQYYAGNFRRKFWVDGPPH